MCDRHTTEEKKRDGKAQELKEEGKTKTIIITETIWNSIYYFRSVEDKAIAVNCDILPDMSDHQLEHPHFYSSPSVPKMRVLVTSPVTHLFSAIYRGPITPCI